MSRWVESKHPRGKGGKFAKTWTPPDSWLNQASNQADPDLRRRKMQPGDVPGYNDLRDMVTWAAETDESRKQFDWIGSTPSPKPRTPAAQYLAQQTEYEDPQTGLRATLTLTHAPGEGDGGAILFNYRIYDSDGKHVGEAERSMETDERGNLVVYHDFFRLDGSVRGGGFAARWNQHMEQFYRANGVTHIKLHADIDVGGYAWAKQGYDFEDYSSLDVVMDRVRGRMSRIRSEVGELEEAVQEQNGMIARGDTAGAASLGRMHGDEPLDQLLAGHREQLRLLGDLEYRSGKPEWDSGEAPTPLEIAMLGWTPGATTWPGKELMLGSDWMGVKQL